MLVAAGLGTRLDPLTRELPKPALPLANRPVAWFSLDHLARSGFTDVVVNTHHLAERLQTELTRVCPVGVRLRFTHEPSILGTGGGVRNAWQPRPDEDFVVVNAKLLFAPDLARALAVHRATGAIATMVLCPLPPGSSFAPVEVDTQGAVRHLRGLPPPHGHGLVARMWSGVQVLSARAWQDLPLDGDIIEHAYLKWLARGEVVASVTDAAPFFDVGVTLPHYLEANLALTTGRVHWPGISPSASRVLRASNVQLGTDSHIEASVLGEGAVIADHTRLDQVVVWPGARVTTSLTRAIVTTQGHVVRC
jgi:mannose-1-phosphate guanylyltransferase